VREPHFTCSRPAHIQHNQEAEEDRPAGSVSDPTFGGVNRLRCRQLADLLVKDAAHSRDHGRGRRPAPAVALVAAFRPNLGSGRAASRREDAGYVERPRIEARNLQQERRPARRRSTYSSGLHTTGRWVFPSPAGSERISAAAFPATGSSTSPHVAGSWRVGLPPSPLPEDLTMRRAAISALRPGA
jgi:hypothetical protein